MPRLLRDLLFKKGFELDKMMKHFDDLKSKHPSASLLATYACRDEGLCLCLSISP